MTTEHFIIELFCRIDNQMPEVRKHPQARLYPSELVTLAVLFVLKGASGRAFYRWIRRDFQHLFPQINERTRLFRLFAQHQDWADYFLAEPTMMGVIDSYGVELIHPIREGRSNEQIGKKGLSNRRWIVGMKWCLLTNQFGLLVGWGCHTANVHDTEFQPLIEAFEEDMIVLSDFGFHAAEGDPANLKICQPKTWSGRMVIETVFSMLTRLCGFKKMNCRAWAYFKARLSFAVVAFNTLVRWHGFKPDEDGFLKLSMAEFSL